MFNKEYLAYKNKITNKFFGVVNLPSIVEKKGDVLLSYMTEPFTLTPKEALSNKHSNYWECYEIARLFSIRGYSVDIINWDNTSYIPNKNYIVCVDTQYNLERLNTYLPLNCIKVAHLNSSYWKFQNDAEENRLNNLFERKKHSLVARRNTIFSNNTKIANYVEGLGNEFSYNTYPLEGKPVFHIPISAVCTYGFSHEKDFKIVSKNYLWIGGGGAVLKGLDLILEAFVAMPEYNLVICGPVLAEGDFVSLYKRELFETNNIRVIGRIDVTGEEFKKILNSSVGVIHASASEGGGGAAIQAMHAGLIPIATRESTVPVGDFGVQLIDVSVDGIKSAVKDLSSQPSEKLLERSIKTWNYVRKHHTREAFSEAYDQFIDKILKL